MLLLFAVIPCVAIVAVVDAVGDAVVVVVVVVVNICCCSRCGGLWYSNCCCCCRSARLKHGTTFDTTVLAGGREVSFVQ